MNLFRPTKFNQWDTADWTRPRVFYGGGKSQQSTSQVSIPPEVLAQYQNVNSIANQVAQTPFSQYSTDPNAFVAPLTTTQQAGVLGTNEYASEAQPFYQQASNLNTPGAIQSYENPYESSVINPTNQLLEQQFNQAQSGQLGNAVQNGAFGGDRSAVTAANLQQQQSLAMGQTDANLLNQNYSQALGASQNAAGLEANIGSGAQSAGLAGAQAQLTAGQAQQQTEQAGLTALYNQFLQQQSYPFQTTQFLGNIAEGTGALSGSTTTSNQPSPYFSDERLKDDIEPIGELYDGQKVIKFRYKGGKQTHVGLSAQDVEKKHPHAVGLAGGYKTVDYDAATRDAADAGKGAHQGGLVMPFRRPDGSTVPERRHFDAGGYAGLSPNSAWNAGFVLDPSYLQSQEQSYGLAPWGNAGPATGSAPYGGKSHVPPSMGGVHASLSVARPPSQSNSSGIQQLSQGLGQLEKLGGQGKSLFNTAKGGVGNLFGSSPQPSATTGGQTSPGNTPPAPHQTPPSSSTPSPGAPAPANPTQMGPEASLDTGDQFADASGLAGASAPDMSDIGDDMGSLFSSRGGLIHRADGGMVLNSHPATDRIVNHPDLSDDQKISKLQTMALKAYPSSPVQNYMRDAYRSLQNKRVNRDSGGSVPSFSQPTDSGQDDQSDSGDVPYDSGTGSSGLDIPDDKSNNKLAVAQPPQQQSGGGGGLGDILGDVGKIASFALPFFAKGGRVGLAGGGDPSDVPLDDPSVFDQQSNAPGLNVPAAQSALRADGTGSIHLGGNKPIPISDSTTDSAPSRDIMVHKAAPPQTQPAAGLAPNVPSPDAQPVQADGPTVPPGDFGVIPDNMRRPTTNTTVQPMSETPGAADAARVGRGFFGGNQDWLVPLMHGLGTMASSNSRYLGSAILQGLGGAADSYENVQTEMMNRGLTGAGIQQGLAGTGSTQAGTGLTQAETGQVQAQTTGHILQNEHTRQALQMGDVFTDGSGNTVVRMPNGQNMYWGDWASKGFPPTAHQVHTTVGNPPASQGGGNPIPGAAGSAGAPPVKPAANYSYLGPAGLASTANDFRTLSRIPPNSPGYANMMDISHKTEEGLQSRYSSAITSGASLNQLSDELMKSPPTGLLASGSLNSLGQDVVNRYNSVVNLLGADPKYMMSPQDLGTEQAVKKLTAMSQFARTQGADQHSMAALEIAGLATPGNYTTKDGQAKILAGLYSLNQQDIDPYNYLQEYKSQVQATSPRPDWYLAQNAMQNFNKDHNSTEYQHIRNGMQDVLSGKYDAGQSTPVYERMLNGTLPPAAQQMLDKKYGVHNFGRIMRNE